MKFLIKSAVNCFEILFCEKDYLKAQEILITKNFKILKVCVRKNLKTNKFYLE